jgi:dTDP-4-dehydrorhamnose 3,5-epimerase
MASRNSGIMGCDLVPVSANRDKRGCLYEIYRDSWPGAFPTVQWNACASSAGALRGVHVHVDYHEFYTLPRGRVLLGLADIRRASPTYGRSVQFDWADKDGLAIIVPRGVAHVILFKEDSVLVFGLSDYWNPKYDVVGCQFDDPELGFVWPTESVLLSGRDAKSGSYRSMLQHYEELSQEWSAQKAAAPSMT